MLDLLTTLAFLVKFIASFMPIDLIIVLSVLVFVFKPYKKELEDSMHVFSAKHGWKSAHGWLLRVVAIINLIIAPIIYIIYLTEPASLGETTIVQLGTLKLLIVPIYTAMVFGFALSTAIIIYLVYLPLNKTE